MYNFIWNIHKYTDPIYSSHIYRAEFDYVKSHEMFKDFKSTRVFRDEDIELFDDEGEAYDEWVENELVNITANYLSSIDPYNKIINNTDIQFNYIRHE